MAKSMTKGAVNVSMIKLREVAKLSRLPPGVKDENIAKAGKKVRVISIADLPEAGFISDIQDSITLSKEKFSSISKYKIEPFDVIMSIQGTVGTIGTVGVVPERLSGDVIANISMLAIRFKENKEDNAIALLQYLKSTHGRKLISRLQKGTTIMRINVKEFAATEVPALSADIKRKSKAVFDKELTVLGKINELYGSLEDIRRSYLV